MYVTAFKLKLPQASFPPILDEIYAFIAEYYHFPPAAMITQGLTKAVDWPEGDYRIIYLDQIHPQVSQHAPASVQIRFAVSQKARAETTIELQFSLTAKIESLEVSFPGKTGKISFARCFAAFKSVAHKQRIDIDTIPCEVEGFSEVSSLFIREHAASAFRYIEGIGWYLHHSENEWNIDSYRRWAQKNGVRR